MTNPFLYLPVEVAARELDAKLLVAGSADRLSGRDGDDILSSGAGG